MKETAWLRMIKPYGYHDNHNEGEIIPVDDPEDIDFLVTNGIAEIVDLEAVHHIDEDREFMKHGVQKDDNSLLKSILVHLIKLILKRNYSNH